jgi:predicted membrane channel-forming protein YqfA (hemolysin III family)
MKPVVLGLVVLGVCAITASLPRIPQDPAYHRMADQRSFAGIPNAFDVLSNLPFIVLGGIGLFTVNRRSAASSPDHARWPWRVFFVATAATALGSVYYHLLPNDARVVWDRLPIAIAFASLLTAAIAERVDARAGGIAFLPLVLFAAGSVALWYWSELAGRGDLRPYVGVQFGSLLILVAILLLYPEPRAETRLLIAGLFAYGVAKFCEWADAPIYSVTHVVSGHTLKHLAAAAGVACVVAMLRKRASADRSAAFSPADTARA